MLGMAKQIENDAKHIPKISGGPTVEGESLVHGWSGQHLQPDERSEDNDPGLEGGGDHAGVNSDEEDGEEGENDAQEDEPKLKYHRLTASLSAVYRNGDSTSSFLVEGDKMIIGTHNGNINVLSMPSFQPLRIYHAHSASITSVSVSPFTYPASSSRLDLIPRAPAQVDGPTFSPARGADSGSFSSPRTPRQPPVPATSSNSLYIATSSIDGHVCVASLIDSKDVMLRNFSRPVQSVALSPEFKSDRSYLSGGLAGNLILTTGGRSGISANANTNNAAAAAASSWLNTIGIGSNTGKDNILHSGEGTISTIKWSLSGKFIVWVNEHGIKIMRSNIKLDSADSDYAWKRIAHVDRPYRSRWEEMAGVWKARAEWIDDTNLETFDDELSGFNGLHNQTDSVGATSSLRPFKNGRPKKHKAEKLVVGWGDTTWVLQVKPEGSDVGSEGGRRVGGSATIVHHLLFDDCIISGLSLYTPSLLLILAYRKHDDDNNQVQKPIQASSRRGVHHRQTGLTPELRLINVVTKEEVDVDTLTMSRYESLSAADYHLGTLYIPPSPVAAPVQRSTFEALGGGLWDVSVNATRIFSSAVSVKSGTGSGDNFMASPPQGLLSGGPAPARANHDAHPAASSPGLKSFILSPYDCVLAVKRDLSDHLSWLLDHSRYKDAWELVNEHPEVIVSTAEDLSLDESQSTPSKHGGQSLVEFFTDEVASQTTLSIPKLRNTAIETERCRIGELWVHQLVSAKDWPTAGQVAGRVLGASPRWEHWVWTFAQAGHFDEITPYIPTKPLHPPLPSLVYEVVLGHYIIHDRPRFRELMDIWEPELFNIESVASAVENKLASNDVREDTIDGGVQGRDWRILLEALARLKLADGKPREALRCHIRLQNADAAMKLIGEYRLVDAVVDDIPGLLTLRVPKDQQGSTPLSELEEASAEGIRLLVDEAYHGTVPPHIVVEQLKQQDSSLHFFLFLYLRALWKGHGTETQSRRIRERLESEGRVLVEDFGDLAVRLFAEYDRLLLMEFLRASRSYSFEKAAAVCESRHYYPELVYLLSQTGQTKRALNLIINSLNDVSLAIEFAKEQDDAELWDDLLEYSMDKPRFIRGLLEEVGTAIDPIKLVRRIPEGLEIEGLREGIGRMVREYEIQGSISEGVARVLKGEVGTGMEALRSGRAKGIEFEVLVLEDTKNETAAEFVKVVNGQGLSLDENVREGHEDKKEPEPGHCVGCGKGFVENETDTLVGFSCGHVYHLSCLMSAIEDATMAAAAERLRLQLAADADEHGESRSVGAKVAHAHIIKNVVREGCSKCKLAGD